MLNASYMPRRFSSLFRQHLDPFTHAWADRVYAERRTDLATLLTFRELVEHVPEVLEELGRLLDERAAPEEICEGARHLRGYARVPRRAPARRAFLRRAGLRGHPRLRVEPAPRRPDTRVGLAAAAQAPPALNLRAGR